MAIRVSDPYPVGRDSIGLEASAEGIRCHKVGGQTSNRFARPLLTIASGCFSCSTVSSAITWAIGSPEGKTAIGSGVGGSAIAAGAGLAAVLAKNMSRTCFMRAPESGHAEQGSTGPENPWREDGVAHSEHMPSAASRGTARSSSSSCSAARSLFECFERPDALNASVAWPLSFGSCVLSSRTLWSRCQR